MTILDVTQTWYEQAVPFGMYIVRSTREGGRDRVRIGVGGIRGGVKGVNGRLGNHLKLPPLYPTLATHEFQPFSIVKVWAFDGWGRQATGDAEMLLYRAFLTRFKRHNGKLKDQSIFVVPEGHNLDSVIAGIQADLEAMEAMCLT